MFCFLILESLVSLERKGKNYTTCVWNLDEESQSTHFLLHDLVALMTALVLVCYTTYLGIQFTRVRCSKSSIVATSLRQKTSKILYITYGLLEILLFLV